MHLLETRLILNVKHDDLLQLDLRRDKNPSAEHNKMWEAMSPD